VTDDDPIEVLYISDDLGEQQVDFTQRVKDRRDAGAARRTLEALKTGAAGDENTMPLILDCVRAYCTVGEISDAMRDVFGTYEEPAVF
jgi:methylmalonyl-CoA mutase, N-terminal domain